MIKYKFTFIKIGLICIWMLRFHLASSQTIAYDSLELSEAQKEEFKLLIMDKINAFQDFLGVISSRQATERTKQFTILSALELFINQGEKPDKCPDGNCVPVEIQVSSLYRPTVTYPIKQYLNITAHSKKYFKVNITQAKACHVGNLYPIDKDKFGKTIYEGVATYFQKYVGYDSEGKVSYEDITQKKVLVRVSFTTGPGGGQWMIKLGDVTVEETKGS